MKILFEDSKEVAIELGTSPLCQVYRSIYKHLQHVEVPYRDWDNPFWIKNQSYEVLVDALIDYGQRVGIVVAKESCLDNQQDYYNQLHKVYEQHYNGDQAWLDFHEHIHLCEHFYQHQPAEYLSIDYRQLSGMLEKPAQYSWMQNAQTQFEPGEVFITWSELGKTPYTYWLNQEPEDFDRLCELAKPWLILKPKLLVATEPVDLLRNKNITDFLSWWSKYESGWCQHWNIPSWSINNMYSGILLGKVKNIDVLNSCLQKNSHVKKVLLQ